MNDAIALLTDPAGQWPWLWVILIVFVAVSASILIIVSMRHAINSMAREAASALTKLDRSSSGSPAREVPSFVTVGEGGNIWKQGACLVRLVRRLNGQDRAEALNAASEALDDLVGRLADLDIIESDVQSKISAHQADAGEWFAMIEANVTILNSDLQPRIAETSLSAGFREERNGKREEVTVEDAHDRACRIAFDDATNNMRSVVTRLRETGDQNYDDLALVDIRMESVAGRTSEEIRKRATLAWRTKVA
ncbi:hypothetical protein [Bosea sp. RAC05]|uniref:hypothetical protein n=1 Tax=Bosea sp. RAC05 TaxID=1842539 RepID=UPI00083CB432|nr:hypothetical protein [Bosea sp. RAC05]AOG03482.1 hypothetical protein BSY19_5306 [Bosea sp. RAC05]